MQTTISLDSFIDKCIVKKFSDEDIQKMIDLIFPNTTCNIQKRKDCIEGYRTQLVHLLSLPKIEQRTQEWYDARQTLITASDFAQALGEGKFGSQKQLIQKKCGFEQDSFNNSAPALKWGTMYEDVACTIYSQRNGMEVHEFGLLRHPTVSHFGASPDGVSDCGIMVEIKCPYKRKIDGTVPMQYFYQIQGQLDVCGLNECDYFECEFFESENIDDICWNSEYEKGAIIEYSETYLYSPVSAICSPYDLTKWVNDQDKENMVCVHYYTLTKCNTIRVYKDETFLQEKMALLDEVWTKIQGYRADEELYNKEIKSAPKVNPFKLNGFAFK